MSVHESKVRYKSLKDSYQREKNKIDGFLFSTVPTELLDILKKLFGDVVNWGKNISEGKVVSGKQQQIVKNILLLKKQLPNLKTINYWQLLQVLLRFPGNFQIAIYNDIVQMMRKQETFQQLPKKIHIDDYENKSLRALLTDYLALSRLREEQIKALDEENIHKSIELEKHFAIIPNHFLLIERIKVDGMVAVYRGINIETDQTIIIKYIVQEKGQNTLNENEKLEYKRFAREAKSFEQLQKYRSKKIHAGERKIDNYFIKAYRLARGKIHNFHFEKEKFKRQDKSRNIEFMVMRYIDGVSLDELLREYRQKNISISLKVAMYVIDSLLQALDYCYQERIIHRDISPQSIHITKQFEVRLTNLGWAGLDMNQLLPKWSFIGSSVSYTAPEGIFQQEENIKQIVSRTDNRFDLYSVGCLAYEMIVGHLPFVSSNPNAQGREKEILQKHLNETPIPPQNTRNEISQKLSEVIMKLLAKNPQERYGTPQEALQELRKSLTLSQKANVIGQKVMAKAPDQTQEFNIAHLPLRKKKRKFLRALIWLLILASPAIYYFREPLLVLAKAQINKYKNYSVYQNVQNDLNSFRERVQHRLERCNHIIKVITDNFPAAKGYPQPDNRIVNILKGQQEYLLTLQKIQEEGKQFFASSFKEASSWATKYQNYAIDNQNIIKILDRAFERIAATERIATSLKKTRDQEKMMRKTHRMLREHIIKTEEWVLALDQKLAILNDRFPVKKGYLPVDPYIQKNLTKAKDSMAKYESVVNDITKQMEDNQFGKAIELALPYKDMNTMDLEYLVDTNDTVQQILSSCENIYKERQQRRALDQTFIVLQNRIVELDNALGSTQKKWEQIQKMSIQISSPDKIFSDTILEAQELRNLVTKVNSLLDEVKEEEAIALLQPYIQGKKTVLTELKSLDEQFKDTISIALAPKALKVNKKDIIVLLSSAKNNLSQISEASLYVDKNLQYLEEEFEKDKFLNDEQLAFLKKTENLQKHLKSLVAKTEEELAREKLEEALAILTKEKKAIQTSNKYVNNLEKLHKYLEQQIVVMQKEKKKQRWLTQVNYIINRLDTQRQRLFESVSPVEKQVLRVRQLYPQDKGYTQIEEHYLTVLTNSKNVLSEYENNLNETRTLIAKDQILEALNLLQPFERKKLTRLDLLDDLKKLEERAIEIEEIAKVERFEKQKVWQMRELIGKLEKRKTEIDTLIPNILSNIDQLQKYKENEGYVTMDAQAKKYVINAKAESEELGDIIQEANTLFHQKQYDSMQSLVTPYADNPPFSMLPLLNTYMEKSSGALIQNRKLQNDSNLRTQRQQKFIQESQKEENLKKWRKSPGSWYHTLSSYLNKYKQLPLKSLLKDRGSLLIHSRIEITIKKIEEYPDLIAELQELLFEIKNHGKTIPKDKHNPKIRVLNEYLATQSIEINISEERQLIEDALYKLQQEIGTSWVEEETLRIILSNLNSIGRKFNDDYIPVKSALINIKYK